MKKSLLIFLSVLVLVTLVVGLMSRTPSSLKEKTQVSEVDLEINKAVEMVNSGTPMEGIMKLRQLLEDNPENARIHYELGHFSVTSGQIGKAIERFEKVLALDSLNYPETYFFLGKLQVEQGITEKGIKNLRQYQRLATDTVIINGIDKMLNEISINQ